MSKYDDPADLWGTRLSINDCIVITDGKKHFLIHDRDWNGEYFDGTPCDKEGTVITGDIIPIWPVYQEIDGGDSEIIGYNYSQS